MWNLLITKKLYKSIGGGIFIDGVNYCEDLNVSTKLIALANRIVHVEKAFYHY